MRKSNIFAAVIILMLTALILAQQQEAPSQEPTKEQFQEIQNKLNSAKDPLQKIEILKDFMARFPQSRLKPGAYNYILHLYANELKEQDTAIAFAENILKTEKTETDKTVAYIFLFNQYLDRDSSRCIEMGQKILALDIREGDLYNNLAYALVDKGLALDLAEKLVNKAISLATLENLKNNPRFRGAPEDYLKRLLNSSLAYYYDTLGWTFFKQAKYKKAIDYLEQSVAKADTDFLQLPASPEALFHLGSCYMKVGQKEKALSFLVKAIIVKDTEEIRSNLSQAYQQKFGSTEGLESYIKKQQAKLARPAPDFTLKDLQGKEVNLSSFKGKVVLLNFWSPGCGACKVEFPHLDALHNKYSKKGLIVLSVDVSNNAQATKKFIEENKFKLPALLDDQRVGGEKYGIQATPTTYFLNKKGKALYRQIGFIPGMEKQMEEKIIELISMKNK